MSNYYETLNVSENATPEEIKRAYREAVKKYHPDLHSNASSEEKRIFEELTKEINEAYSVLSDAEKRRDYDFMLHSRGGSAYGEYEETSQYYDSYNYEREAQQDNSFLGQIKGTIRFFRRLGLIGSCIILLPFLPFIIEFSNLAMEKHRKESFQNMLAEKAAEKPCMPDISYENLKVGECVSFGNYPYEKNGMERPIQWFVLENDGKKALLISRYGIDSVPYNKEEVPITWENASIRQWLNNDFINSAFTSDEQRKILKSYIENKDYVYSHLSESLGREYKTVGGNDTIDKIFLLSEEEVKYYLVDEEQRRTWPTPYADKKGAYIFKNFGKAGWQPLRSSCYVQSNITEIDPEGGIGTCTYRANIGGASVRPAMWIETESGNVHQGDFMNLVRFPDSDGDDIVGIEAFDEYLSKLNTPATNLGNADNYKEGDIIKFGTYPYGNDGEKVPIEFIILEKYPDGTALLISRYGIEAMPYNEKHERITWENSSIRAWLNNDFINKAFSPEERMKIQATFVINKDNADKWTKGGKNTMDKVFLLSIDEAKKYFKYKEDGKMQPSPYLNKRFFGWWLRSPGEYQGDAADVSFTGYVSSCGSRVDNRYNAVRPALRIDFKDL